MDEPPTAASLSSPAVTIPEQEEPVFDRGRAAWLTLIGGYVFVAYKHKHVLLMIIHKVG
jgi:hypothetical protein